MEAIKVAIIDRTGYYIDAIMSVLEQQPDVEVVATQVITEDDHWELDDAEIVILQQESVQLTRRLIQRITTKLPAKKLVVLGASDDDQVLVGYIESGAIGYVRVSETFDQLLQIIRVVHNGGAIIHPELIAPLCLRLADIARSLRKVLPEEPEELELTPRQQEVMELLAEGLSNQEIADELSISVGTVKNHIHKIFSLLGVGNRDQAVSLYSKLSDKIHSRVTSSPS